MSNHMEDSPRASLGFAAYIDLHCTVCIYIYVFFPFSPCPSKMHQVSHNLRTWRTTAPKLIGCAWPKPCTWQRRCKFLRCGWGGWRIRHGDMILDKINVQMISNGDGSKYIPYICIYIYTIYLRAAAPVANPGNLCHPLAFIHQARPTSLWQPLHCIDLVGQSMKIWMLLCLA